MQRRNGCLVAAVLTLALLCVLVVADAVLAASIFHYRTHSIREVKEYMQAKGVPVRLI